MARKKKKTSIFHWGRALLLVLIFALAIKGFLGQSYIVDSARMEKTLRLGDLVWVNKLAYGPRLPITLLSMPFYAQMYSPLIKLPYFRLPGFKNIERNHIIAFNYPEQFDPPIDKRQVLFKRCVGLPGDTISLNNKVVFVNQVELGPPKTALFTYRISTVTGLLDDDFLEKYDIVEGGMVAKIGIYDFSLDRLTAESIEADSKIKNIRELKDYPGENSGFVFPQGFYYAYNKDYFGPVVIPFKGQIINLTMRNIELYRQIIEQHEHHSVAINADNIFINGIQTSTYTIQQNYYFVLDDNRDNAKDSRYWGFLPESYIIGKASWVWFSRNQKKDEIRWNRIFKKV